MVAPPTLLSSAEIVKAREILRTAPLAYLAMVEPDGPYVIPLNFVYAEDDGGAGPKGLSAASTAPAPEPGQVAGLGGRIYFHTGDGRKAKDLAADPRVCLAVTDCVAFHQGDSPCADGFSFRSILVWGDARLLEDENRREAALRTILAKYDQGAAETPFNEAVFARTLLYEVVIEAAGYKERLPRL
jgi:nitroimidazol reductase NimA-like FMN-containing flavoprotein (pyridoxamine 5'-phosphate oxidase superfamily)